MFHSFVEALRRVGLPVSIREHLMLIEAIDRGVIEPSLDAFYHLARATFVKDEAMVDRFDRAFGKVFGGIAAAAGVEPARIPADWLRAVAERYLSPEEMAEIAAAGDWNQLMDRLRERLAEQDSAHHGGSKWIGTGGTSPFGHGGYNPEGIRIGGESRHKRAVKVWEAREFRNLDSNRELGTRNLKVALRRLRRFARDGLADELDLDATIAGTARRGWLDIAMRPERRNAVKLLLFLDVGGSMDPFVERVEELFSAATAEFRQLEFFYFHNCIYEGVWRDNRRRFAERIATTELLRTYGADYRLVVVGDAAMSPYEIVQPGGSVEHHNDEAGAVWLQRMTAHWRSAAWINPVPQQHWEWTQSTRLVRDLFADRMYPLTLAGLDDAMRELSRRR
ncbi:VWA domain-containing protein [Sphingomonas sp. 2R-10]|uniref:vWA domain-containing protein n=1 Tax=Sphingomonas sp. 2R-10 TaxID=3045148 RepID=UPI000F772995|nr:VWA domain-containing protein [Sphingomonas sp. 2R-10]MDJ0278066.1 VWA domain-containing protein [Sphingomonas sp. 2R-10]